MDYSICYVKYIIAKVWNDFIVVARRIINLVKIIGNYEKNEYWYNIVIAKIFTDRVIYYIDISCNEDNYGASNYLDLDKTFILKNSGHLIYYSSHLKNFNRDQSDIIIKYNCPDNHAENDFTLPRNAALIFNNFVLSLWKFFRMQPRDGN